MSRKKGEEYVNINIAEKIINGKDGIRVQLIADNMVRVRIARSNDFSETALSRYGFLQETGNGELETTIKDSPDGFIVESSKIRVRWSKGNGLSISDRKSGGTILEQSGVELTKKNATVRFNAKKSEDWIGFGDQTRTRLYHRGTVADLYVRNVKSYIPVPFFMSTGGYGILVNTTHRIVFDMAKTKPDEFSWTDHRGEVDYFIMLGSDFKEILNVYTELTGKPKLPPEWAFGLWYICRTQANDLEAVNDALNFRREEIPCDVIGLEPGWMETYYDLTSEKKWNKKLFPIPSWAQNGPHNFINAIKRMGFHFELWLSNEYDLSHEEERRRGRMRTEEEKANASFHEGAEIDEHFAAPRLADTITKKDEPWFQHLKKFVDQGADFFKQDGAYQVCDHPDRVWGNGMLDAEMHNLYPLLYSRQMHEGFTEHTGRRPVVFTPAGWAGFQAWCGTWTGDTGGRLETLGAMLNTSIVGHSWSTNDMEVMQKEGIHFGYLQPWSQINSWYYFRMPWVQGDELCSMHKFYSQFRARLIPYLYSWAYHATKTGFPLMAPLTLEFPSDESCRSNLHQYLLGRDLMVGIYKNEIYLPEGKWKDYWTGDLVGGRKNLTVAWPVDKGGSLYVREGGIIPFGPLMQYRKQKPTDEIELYVFPGEKESSMEFYEDDGVSLKHINGECAKTEIRTCLKGKTAALEIGRTIGNYDGMPQNRAWSFIIALPSKPSDIKVNGKLLPLSDWRWNSSRNELAISNLKGEKISLEATI
jgi:alpha-glucosidase (family GH31 glycosyl hydrolase)